MKLGTFSLAVFTASAAQALAAGPFGVTMGSSISEYSSCKSMTPGYYSCTSLPRAHPDLVEYILQAYPETGVCWVKGLSKRITNDEYGNATRQLVDDIADQISETYGSKKKTDFIKPSAIYTGPREWAASIFKKERYYAYTQEEKQGAKLKDSITSILVGATGAGLSDATVAVEFYFKNEAECQRVEKGSKGEVLLSIGI